MSANADITIIESRLFRTLCSHNRHPHSQSGLSPYLLIRVSPSNIHVSLHASMPCPMAAVRNFHTKNSLSFVVHKSNKKVMEGSLKTRLTFTENHRHAMIFRKGRLYNNEKGRRAFAQL